MSAVECWRMQSGRIASIEFDSTDPRADPGARDLLRMNGAVPIDEKAEKPCERCGALLSNSGGMAWFHPNGLIMCDARQPVQAYAGDEYDEARRLRNEEGPAMQGEAFENTPTTSKETEMLDTTVADIATPTYDPHDVSALLEIIESAETGLVTLEPGDALYQDIPTVLYRPAAGLEGLELGGVVSVNPLIDRTGRLVQENPPSDWWTRVEENLAPRVRMLWKLEPNTAVRLGDVLSLSLGRYVAADRQTLDGIDTFELVTVGEANRRDHEKRAEWAAEHPEITTMFPWADSAAVEYIDAEGTHVYWERKIGPVWLTRHAVHANGTFTFDDDSGAPAVMIDRDNIEDMTVTQMRETASALMAAIPIVEAERMEAE